MLIFLIMKGWGVGNSKTERVLTWREPCGIALEDDLARRLRDVQMP